MTLRSPGLLLLALHLLLPVSALAQDPDPVEIELFELCERMAGQAAGARRTFIESVLEADGIAFERLPFVDARLKGVNLELRFGPEEGPPLVLAAHHDVRTGSAGANDDASGCAVLLALARRLRQRDGFALPLRILFLDGSQKGLLGAQAWCEARRSLAVDRVLVLDLCGRGDRLVVGSSLRPYANRAPALVADAEVLAGDLPTDHKAFAAEGLDAAFLTLCPEADLELLRGRYETRDFRAALPAYMTDVLRGRDRAAEIEKAALARALEAVLAAVDRAATERSAGQSPLKDFAARVKALDEALVAGESEAAAELIADLGVNGFLEALARPAPEEAEEREARARNALRLVAGTELRRAIEGLLADPAAARGALGAIKGRIRAKSGHFRLIEAPENRD